MRIRIAIVTCLLGFGSAYAQPAPEPTPPPANAPPGQDQAETPNFEITPLEGGQPEQPPLPDGPGPGPRADGAEQSDVPPPGQTLGTEPTAAADVTAAAQPQSVGLEAAANEAIREDYPALVTSLTVAESSEGLLEVDGVVPVLGDKLGVNEALTDLAESDIVVNRIKVAPPHRADTAIERDVRKALRKDELLRTLSIIVDTRNQRVFLTGRVPTPLMAQTALRAASDVRGVRDVNIDRLRTPLP